MNEDPIQPTDENANTSGDSQKPESKPPVAPVDISKINSPENSQTSDTQTKKRKRKPLTCFEIWTVIFASLGILVAAGTGAAIVWQDLIGARTLAEIKRGARPWVGMSGEVSWARTSENGFPTFTVSYKLKNFGSFPALHTVAWIQSPERDVNNYQLIKSKVISSCKAAEGLITQTGDLLLPTGEKPDTWTYDAIPPTKFVIPGCIAYQDTESRVHHTQLCYWIDLSETPKPSFRTCWFQSAD
jgi:hypothetical protein